MEPKRFPKDFMFQLTKEDFEGLRFQIETLEKRDNPLRLQNETLRTGRGQHSKYLPYAFYLLHDCHEKGK